MAISIQSAAARRAEAIAARRAETGIDEATINRLARAFYCLTALIAFAQPMNHRRAP